MYPIFHSTNLNTHQESKQVDITRSFLSETNLHLGKNE